jgi:glycosyltransferase involved in cell wall biosynthesis
MVLLEAMAAGVPVICSDCGGGREVVAGVGQVFEFRNKERLSSSLVGSSKVQGTKDFSLFINNYFSDDAARKQFVSLSSTCARLGGFDVK